MASSDPVRGRSPATAIIVVGDEILTGFTLDTNSHHLAARTFAAGFPVSWILTVGDDVGEIAAAVRRAVADPKLDRIAVCGGIGPTPDDRTWTGVAVGLGVALEENPEAMAAVAARVRWLHEQGRVASIEVSAANRRMALLPSGARVLRNDDGMAPAVAIALPGDDAQPPRWLFVLPGVPREFTRIVDDVLIPEFFGGGQVPQVDEVVYTGIAEAEFADAMVQLAGEFPDVVVGSYPQSQRRELVIRLRGPHQERVAAARSRLLELRPPISG